VQPVSPARPDHTDLLVVGAGIVGLAHALAGARRGWRVTVVERDHRCVGASIRNFGFVTVTGQAAGDTWRRARASRDTWAEVAPQAGIAVEHRGVWVLARRPAAAEVLQAFMETDMADGCTLVDAAEAGARVPQLRTEGATAALHSPHELRVESRTAIPRLAAWLAERHNVRFLYGEEVLEVTAPRVRTASRTLHADRIVVCPGTELNGVAGAALRRHALRLTRLQMLRVRPEPGFTLPAAVMGDLSLVRYGGFASQPAAKALLAQLQDEEAASLDHGIHLIAVQSADGTLVVGDSHHDAASPEPFADEAVDRLILRHLRETLDLEQCEVVERWTGVYPVGAATDCVIEAPDDATRVVVVSSGTGASTGFAIGEEVVGGF
jgi:FAD dependent oxidoreductase TIGR03364